MLASGLCAVRQEPGIKGEADGLKDRDVPPSGRLKHGPDIGVERSPPRGSKAVGDLAEHNAGPERLFGAIVGWRDGPVGDEHEQVLAEALDNTLELLSGRGRGRDREQDVEPFLKARLVEHEELTFPPKWLNRSDPNFTLPARTILLYRPAFGLGIALYGLLCDFGRSYVRPLCGLLLT